MHRNIIPLLILIILGSPPNIWPSPDSSTDLTIRAGDVVHFENDGYDYKGEVSHVFSDGRVRIAPYQHVGRFASFYRGEFWGDVADFSKRVSHFGEISENDEVHFELEGYNQVGRISDIFSNGRVRLERIMNSWGRSDNREFWLDAEDLSRRVNHVGDIYENNEVHFQDEWGYDHVGVVTYLFSNGRVRIAHMESTGFSWTDTENLCLSERELTLRREREATERERARHQREFNSLVRELYHAPLSEHRYFQRLSIRAPQTCRAFLIPLLNTMRAEVESENSDTLFVNIRVIISGTKLRHLPHIKWNIRLTGAEIFAEGPLLTEAVFNRVQHVGNSGESSSGSVTSQFEGLRVNERSTLSEEPPLDAISRD